MCVHGGGGGGGLVTQCVYMGDMEVVGVYKHAPTCTQ